MTNIPPRLLLLVEDEVAVCEIFEEALKDAGFDVAVAHSSSAALILLQRLHKELAGLITDIDLGSSVNGWSVAHTARQLQPALPVVYMSGARAADWAVEGVADSAMLAKPFKLEDLTQAVRASFQPRGSIVPPPSPWASDPPERSAAGYRARADDLADAAAATESPTAAATLRNQALEWRKLAITADWQEAMTTALERAGATLSPVCSESALPAASTGADVVRPPAESPR